MYPTISRLYFVNLRARESPCFFIDGIDKIVDPAVQLTVNDLLKVIAASDGLWVVAYSGDGARAEPEASR